MICRSLLFGGYSPQVNDTFFIILNDSTDAITGTFSNFTGGLLTSGFATYQVNYAANGDGGGTANDVSIKVISIPEPGAWPALLSGCMILAGFRRHRRSRSV